jgi:serine/threonine-protein kinase
VVHRDLKPQNIMVCNDGSLRIMDFGIAKSTGERKISFSGFSPTMGTPDYMAPEQVRGQPGDEQTDIYSLGAILYEMTTGSVPYQGDNAFVVMNSRLSGDPVAPRKLRPEIPPALEEIILHAMERDPGGRYLSVTGFKSDLDHQDIVRITGRAGRLQPPKLWHSQWRRVRAGVFAVIFILTVFGLIYVISHAERANVRPRPRNYKGR